MHVSCGPKYTDILYFRKMTVLICLILQEIFGLTFGSSNLIHLGYLTGSEQPGALYYRRPGQTISGALTFALDQINSNSNILPHHKLDIISAETLCKLLLLSFVCSSIYGF
jgi:hypothetical protein